MMVRFSPACEFSRSARGEPAARSAAAFSPRDAAAGRSTQRFISVSTRALMSARSSLERGNVAQALFDIFAVGFLSAFASLLGLAIVAAPVAILFFVLR